MDPQVRDKIDHPEGKNLLSVNHSTPHSSAAHSLWTSKSSCLGTMGTSDTPPVLLISFFDFSKLKFFFCTDSYLFLHFHNIHEPMSCLTNLLFKKEI